MGSRHICALSGGAWSSGGQRACFNDDRSADRKCDCGVVVFGLNCECCSAGELGWHRVEQPDGPRSEHGPFHVQCRIARGVYRVRDEHLGVGHKHAMPCRRGADGQQAGDVFGLDQHRDCDWRTLCGIRLNELCPPCKPRSDGISELDCARGERRVSDLQPECEDGDVCL